MALCCKCSVIKKNVPKLSKLYKKKKYYGNSRGKTQGFEDVNQAELHTIMSFGKRDHTSSGNAWRLLQTGAARVHEDHIVLNTAEDPV